MSAALAAALVKIVQINGHLSWRRRGHLHVALIMFASCAACVAPSTPLAYLLLLLVVIMIAVVTFIIHRQTQSAKTSGLVSLVLCGIAIAELLVASTGVLTKFDQVPPSMVILLVPCLLINIYFSCFVKLDSLKLDQVPLSTLVGFQCFRFGPELFLHLGYLEGSLPAQMTYPPDGRNIDVIVAAFALCLWLLSLDLDLRAKPLTSPKVVWAFALLGFCSLLNILFTAMASLAHPLKEKLFPWFEIGLEAVAYPPFVLLPGFLFQLALCGHLLLFRRLLLERRPPEFEQL